MRALERRRESTDAPRPTGRMMTATLIESQDEHHWVLLDHRVTELAFDTRSVRFRTWSLDASAEVWCAAPISLRQASGAERRLDPAETEKLGPLLALLRRPVQSITLTRGGELSVAFGGGLTLSVAADRRIDAWEVQGGGALEGLRYRCVAGGEMVWG
jgi:hypothetical protein